MTDYYKHKVAYMGRTVLETKLTANGVLSNSVDLTAWHVDYIHKVGSSLFGSNMSTFGQLSVRFWPLHYVKKCELISLCQYCDFEESFYAVITWFLKVCVIE